MTQSIATQTGSLNVSFSNSNTYTLFTQNGAGNASRVILNYLAAYMTTSSSGNPQFTFSIYDVASGNRVPIGAIIGTNNFNISGWSMFPMNLSGATSTFNNTSAYNVPNISLLISQSAANVQIGNDNPNSLSFNTARIATDGVYFPSQFYMQSGSSLQFKSNWGSQSGYIQYSFTLITEL